jgi:hypothetical protein
MRTKKQRAFLVLHNENAPHDQAAFACFGSSTGFNSVSCVF